MKSTEAAAKDRQSEDTAMSKILQKRIRDREPRLGIVSFPVVHALARAPRLEILSVLGAGWACPEIKEKSAKLKNKDLLLFGRRRLERRSEKTEMARPFFSFFLRCAKCEMGTPRRVGAPGARSRKVESLKKEWHELLSKCLCFFRMFFFGTKMERDKEHKIDCIIMHFLKEEQQ